jgi:3-methylfumaryl-CoA hydratase
MEEASALDIDRLRSWIGREEESRGFITSELVAKFNATFDRPSAEVQENDVAPQLIHFCLGQPAARMSDLGLDGHPQRGGFLPPVPLPRRMWAGGSFHFHRHLRVGDSVRRVSRVAGVSLKEGTSGPLCFVNVEHVLDVDGELAVEENQTIVYRGMGAEAKRQPIPAAEGQRRRRVDASSVLLFRYSALTFNGHRIHYDNRHATEVEGYPGLVVHGPLQATFLLDFAAELRGRRPTAFKFRSLSPLFDGGPCILHAREDGERLNLWTAAENGPVAMEARAEWQ